MITKFHTVIWTAGPHKSAGYDGRLQHAITYCTHLNTIFFWVNLDYKLKRTVKNANIINFLSDMGNKLLQAAVFFSGKTSNVVLPYVGPMC